MLKHKLKGEKFMEILFLCDSLRSRPLHDLIYKVAFAESRYKYCNTVAPTLFTTLA